MSLTATDSPSEDCLLRQFMTMRTSVGVMNPSPSTILAANDVLIVAGLAADLAQLDATQRVARAAA